MGCGVELVGEEFEVVFLGVVVVLIRAVGFWLDGEKYTRMLGRVEGVRTQKKAPHVPLVPVTFMPTRNVPYNMSSLVVATSAIGINPSAGTPPLTNSCIPASPPLIPSPAQSYWLFRGLATTLARDAFLPYGPRAASGVTV